MVLFMIAGEVVTLALIALYYILTHPHQYIQRIWIYEYELMW